MTNDTSDLNLPAISDPNGMTEFSPLMIEEYILQHTEMAGRWLTHAQELMSAEEVDPNAVLLAICSANDNLTALEGLKPTFAGFVAGVEAAMGELVHQRDEAVVNYEKLDAQMEERVRRGVNQGIAEALDQAFATDEDAEQAEIDMLARQMVLGDEEDVINDTTKQLARKLRAAKELAAEYRAHGLPDEEYVEDYTTEIEGWDDDDSDA